MELVSLPVSSWNSITSRPTDGSNWKLGLTNTCDACVADGEDGEADGAGDGVAAFCGASVSPEPIRGRPAWIENRFDMADNYKTKRRIDATRLPTAKKLRSG